MNGWHQCPWCLDWTDGPVVECLRAEPECPVQCILGWVWVKDAARDVWVAVAQRPIVARRDTHATPQ